MARFEEAIAEGKRAQQLDPASLLANSELAWVLMMARRYDDAVAQYEKTLELDPNYGPARGQMAWCYTLQGR